MLNRTGTNPRIRTAVAGLQVTGYRLRVSGLDYNLISIIKSYRDLDIYNQAFDLAIVIHKMSLTLPKYFESNWNKPQN